MPVGRKLLFCLLFFSLSIGVASQTSFAQQQHAIIPRHPWDKQLTTEELRAAFTRLGMQKSGNDLKQFEALKELFQNQIKENPDFLKQLGEIQGNPELTKKFKDQFAGDSQISPDAIANFLKDNRPALTAGKDAGTVPSPQFNKSPITPPRIVPGGDNPVPSSGFPDGKNNSGVMKMGPLKAPPPGGGNKFADPPPPTVRQLDAPQSQVLPPPEAFHNPFGKPNEPLDPRAQSMQQMAAMWERNVGPLDETPEIKRAFFDLVSGDSGFDFDLKDGQGNDWMDLFKGGGGDDGSGFNDLFNGSDGDWKMPQFDLPSLEWGKWFGNFSPSSNSSSSHSSLNRPSSSSSSGGGGSSFGGIGGLGVGFSWLVLSLALLLILGYGIWLYMRGADLAKTGLGDRERLGPWPIDPRAINSREDIVKAFEYLSVLICGPSARAWTHGTIAESLAALARTDEETAMKLARLYELARYTPLEEALSRREVLEARRLVCDLAEVTV